ETLGIVGEAIQRQNNEILKWVKFTRETLGIVGEAIQRQNNEILRKVGELSALINQVRTDLRSLLVEIRAAFAGLLTALATATGAIMALITAKTAAVLATIAAGFATVNASLAALRLQLTQLGITLGLVRNKVNEIDTKLSIDITGTVDNTACDDKQSRAITYRGRGLQGLSEQVKATAELIETVKSQVCTIKRPDCPTTRIEVKIFRACKTNPANDQDVADFDLISLEVPQTEAGNIKELHDRIFELQSEDCREKTEDCIAAVPEWWQVRLGADRPQLVVQYAEVIGFKDGKPKYGAPMYALTIPHYRLNREQTRKELFPSYIKGQSMGILVLDDNSKLIINCENQEAAESVIEQLSAVINPNLRQNAHLSIGVRQGQNLKNIAVHPRIAKFFATGQQDMKPTWVRYFKDDE
ncbi:hypothetical protein IQ250_20905, partial [Pseudanabaenaceae cyanobacterium LEGE 13415]|nr:hypothetical protein [Pseudanabaenaceae cyanobacterium LEGE 13415]